MKQAESEFDNQEKKLTKQIAKGGGIVFFGRFFGKVIKFLFQVTLTRSFGANTYGLYILGYNILQVSSIFSMLGLHNGVVRFGSIYQEKNENYLKGTLILALIIPISCAVVISLLLFIFAGFISDFIFNSSNLTNIIKIFVFALPFYVLMIVISNSFRIRKRMEYEVGIRFILHKLILLMSGIIVSYLSINLTGVIYGFIFSSVFSALVGVFYLFKCFPELISKVKPKYNLKQLLFYSLTVFLVGFSNLLLTRTDKFMLGIFSLTKGVGIYNVAMTVSAQLTLVLHSFNSILSPIIAELHSEDNMERLKKLFKITTKWIVGFTFPIFLIIILFSRKIMTVFGSEFVSGSYILIVLGFSQLLNASVGSAGVILNMTGKQNFELMNSILLGIINVFLNIFFIQKFGVLGAGIATASSIILINFIRVLQIYYLYNMHPYKLSFWKPITAGVLLFFFWKFGTNLWQFEYNLWIIEVVIFVLLYFLVVILFGLDEEDKIVFLALKKRLI